MGEMFATTERNTLLIFGFLLLLATLADAEPIEKPAEIQLYQWVSRPCPGEEATAAAVGKITQNRTRLALWNNRGNLFKLCSNGKIADARLVGDVNDATLFGSAVKECVACERNTGSDWVNFGLGLSSAFYSGLGSVAGPTLSGFGALWNLMGYGSPGWSDIMAEVDRKIKVAQSQMSQIIINSTILDVMADIKKLGEVPNTPYQETNNPRCVESPVHVPNIQTMLITSISQVEKIDLTILSLELLVKTLPLVADLVYVGHTHQLGIATQTSCGQTYRAFRSDWRKLLHLVGLLEKKYKEKKICPTQGSPTIRSGEPGNCERNQWKCYHKKKGFKRVIYCGDDGFHGTNYYSRGVHFRESTYYETYESRWPQIPLVRTAFFDNQALLLDPIKEYIARLQKDVDQLCGYCSLRESMADPDRAIPVEIFLAASSQNLCTGSNLPACVTSIKRNFKRPNPPALDELADDLFDFCGKTQKLEEELHNQAGKNKIEGQDTNTLEGNNKNKKGGQDNKDKNKQKGDQDNNNLSFYQPPTCDRLQPSSLRTAEIPVLSHGDRLQPWYFFLLSIVCSLWVVE
jgi:hypothetical protein